MNVDSLKSEFRGELLTPDSAGYDAARRLWNGMIDRRPAVIPRCTGPHDVIAAVRFAASWSRARLSRSRSATQLSWA